VALAVDLASGHVQRGEQVRDAVLVVIVGELLARVESVRQQRLGPVQRLNLSLLINAEHDRATRRGQVQLDDVGHLVGELRIADTSAATEEQGSTVGAWSVR
jgi:hypothetical protein